ncbi:MAG: hypothetical protein ABJP34_12000 [Erythrobacter sp.]
MAQNAPSDSSGDADYVDRLKSCQTIAEDAARLACFDSAVGSIVTATDSGELQILDEKDVEQTRRNLFGLSLPKLKIFGDSEDDSKEAKKKRELLETTITSVHYSKPTEIFFVTTEGATWRISNVPSRLRTVKVGQTVVLKRAAMGSFFIRINGQTGVKGRRVR